jgi:hypothetical protein
MTDSALAPVFDMPNDRQGNPLNKDDFLQWQNDCALELSKVKNVWGPHYENDPGTTPPIRLNPWHPKFDKSTFWM